MGQDGCIYPANLFKLLQGFSSAGKSVVSLSPVSREAQRWPHKPLAQNTPSVTHQCLTQGSEWDAGQDLAPPDSCARPQPCFWNGAHLLHLGADLLPALGTTAWSCPAVSMENQRHSRLHRDQCLSTSEFPV